MSAVQSLKNRAYVIEKVVTLAGTSGTTVGPAVGAGTIVLAAGFETLQAVPDVTTYTIDVTDGTTVFVNDASLDNVAAGTLRAGFTAGLITAADTIDVVTTISGTPGTVRGRVWALVADVGNEFSAPGTVDREQLA